MRMAMLIDIIDYIRFSYEHFINAFSSMPYRRLPNTDLARIRAMKKALEKGKETPPPSMAYSAKSLLRLQKFLPLFEHNIQLHKLALASQNAKSKIYNEAFQKAKIYITHFLRVMNMAVFRGDLPVETRVYYGLPTNELKVPLINTEKELITWGRRIIEGEELRLQRGGSPITNPTIAVVKVRFENFLEVNNLRQDLIKKAKDFSERSSDMRKEADEIILRIWNEVEEHFSSLPDDVRKQECEEYGLVYVLRKSELIKIATRIVDDNTPK